MSGREFDPSQSEWMDREQSVSRELEADLVNLAAINRQFGGRKIWRHFVRRWMQPRGHYRVIDFATGGGDGPRCMVDLARRLGATVEITAVDALPATLELARRWSAGYPEIRFRRADILASDSVFEEGYDFAFCSLALHHFSAADAVNILRRLRASARLGALAADLRRGFVCRAGAWLVTATLYRAAMTKHDARMSARRAFSDDEMQGLARAAEWPAFGHRAFAFGRQALWWEAAEAV